MSAVIAPQIKKQYFDNNGDPLASGKLYVYDAGTTDEATSYTTQAGDTANANPIILDSAGRVGGLFLVAGSYKFVLKDSDDATVWTEDNITVRNLGSEIDALSDSVASIDSETAPSNRLVSGASSSNSSKSMLMTPDGSAGQVTVLGATTSLVYVVDGLQFALSQDVIATGLLTAPTSNNTALINDALFADDNYTKTLGEDDTVIPYDSAGSEITALDGQIAAFKIAGATTGYFIAHVDNGNSHLIKAKRGYFFDSSGDPIERAAFSDNDTLTLMKLTWIYLKSDQSLLASYTEPVYSPTEPSAPAVGDMWYDMVNNTWKRFNSTSFTDAEATPIGICIQDESGNTVAARSFEFYKNAQSTNTFKLDRLSNTQVESRGRDNSVNVNGTLLRFREGPKVWDITSHLESGQTEAASTQYYCYIKENGGSVISSTAPIDESGSLYGHYHPYETWRFVGSVSNDGSSNFESDGVITRRSPLFLVHDRVSIISKSAAYKASPLDEVILADTSGGAWTLTLPSFKGLLGHKIVIKKTTDDENALTIDGNSSETIDGATTINLDYQYDLVELVASSSQWEVLRRESAKVKLSELSNINTTALNSGVTTFLGFTTTVTDKDSNMTNVNVNNTTTANDATNYVVPVSGVYSVKFGFYTADADIDADELIAGYVYLDAGQKREFRRDAELTSATPQIQVTGTAVFEATKGQKIRIGLYHEAGAAVTPAAAAASSFFSVHKVN